MDKLSELEICSWLKRKVYHDGENLRWQNAHKKALNGTICGKCDKDGYRRINNVRYGMVQVHRLIFFMTHGYLPKFVDHRDGNPQNNRIDNLRAADIYQNAQNCKTPVTNTSGRKGVYQHKATGKWQASIRAEGRLIHLGIFGSFDDAVKAREDGEKKYHGQFTRI